MATEGSGGSRASGRLAERAFGPGSEKGRGPSPAARGWGGRRLPCPAPSRGDGLNPPALGSHAGKAALGRNAGSAETGRRPPAAAPDTCGPDGAPPLPPGGGGEEGGKREGRAASPPRLFRAVGSEPPPPVGRGRGSLSATARKTRASLRLGGRRPRRACDGPNRGDASVSD